MKRTSRQRPKALTAAAVAARIDRFCPARGRLNVTLYDYEKQAYRNIPRLSLPFFVHDRAETHRLFEQVQAVVVNATWQNAAARGEVPGVAPTDEG